MRDDFAAFILTHGRADNVITYKTLRRSGYTGRIIILIDNQDSQEEAYMAKYGDMVYVFDKDKEYELADSFTNNGDMRVILYARNAARRVAKELGIRYFIELDDDYTGFEFRKLNGKKLNLVKCKHLDDVFEGLVTFLEHTPAHTIALAQGGDFIGGAQSGTFKKQLLRKAMNTFVCDTERPFWFRGRINEDVNTYATLGSQGYLIFTITKCMVKQVTTQKNQNGMTDVYKLYGTYVKSFYTVMTMPSAARIGMMGDKEKRIHHKIKWERCCPKILSPKWKKTVIKCQDQEKR